MGRESHHGVELIEIEPASVALVGGARCGVAIGHDRLASLERRTDDLGDMLGLVGDDKQGFGPIVERGMRRVEQDRPNRTADLGRAELEGQLGAEA